MVSARWEEIKVVFEAALLREEGEWQGFVADACGGDHELADEVYRLLLADQQISKFLEEPAYSHRAFEFAEFDEILRNSEILCDRFRIVALLGEGGMGRVYEAFDLELQERIAVKAIRDDIADIPSVLMRFKREVYATRKVTHPNVCRTFDLESHTVTRNGTKRKIAFLTMELLQGDTLANRLHRTGPLAEKELETLAVQLASALLAAHEAGIVHCDLKPSNIFMTSTEAGLRAVVTDFGIARFVQQQDQIASPVRAGTGTLIGPNAGTPQYMAPEQAEQGVCTAASDIYSYGLVLYEALTGKRPPRQNWSPSEMDYDIRAARALQFRDVPLVALKWSSLLSGCLQPSPQNRLADAQQVLALLNPTAGFLSPQAIVDGVAPSRKLPWLWYGAFSSAVLIVIVVVWPLLHPAQTLPAVPSVAVLPLTSNDHDPQIEAVAGNLTDNLTNELVPVFGIKVQRVAGKTDPSQSSWLLGKKLGVDTLLEGSVSWEGDGVAVEVKLVNARTNGQFWGHRFTSKRGDLAELQLDIAQETAFQLRTKAAQDSRSAKQAEYVPLPAVAAMYAKGLAAQSEHTPKGYQNAVSYFMKARDADHQYALARAQLANTYILMATNYQRPEAPIDLLEDAETSAREALQIDGNSAEGYTSLAETRLLRYFDWENAKKDYERATKLHPENVPAHTSYASLWLTARSKFGDAYDQFRYADDGKTSSVGTALGRCLEQYYARHYEVSAAQATDLKKKVPANEVVSEILALDYLEMKNYPEAIASLQKMTTETDDARTSRDAMLGLAYAMQGKVPAAAKQLEKLEADNHFGVEFNYNVAALSAALGDHDKAFDYLEKAYARRQISILYLNVDPLMDPLKADPRFQRMLDKMNLL